MFYKQNGSKIVNEEEINCKIDGEDRGRDKKQLWYAIGLAILMNGILMLGSYNYAQHLAYRESVQVIKLENYKMNNQDEEMSDISQKSIETKHIDKETSDLIVSLN